MKLISINGINFSARAKNILKNLKITNLQELAALSEEEILRSKNCGKLTLIEIQDVLHSYGLSFRMRQGYLSEILPSFITNSGKKEKSQSTPNFFDTFLLDTSGISTRLRNAIESLRIKTVGDLRKHFNQLKRRQGLGAKSNIELETLVLQNTGFHDFSEIIITRHNISTSPSFITFLKRKFRNISQQMQLDICNYLTDNLESIPPMFHKYAEEYLTRSTSDLTLFKTRLQSIQEHWGELNLNNDLLEILKRDEQDDIGMALNDIIISQSYISNHIYQFAKELDLIIESGFEDYKKGKIPKDIADQLLHNEADTIDKACKKVCSTNLYLDVFSKRLFATNDDEATLQEVADLHGLTRERIRQIEKKLLTRFQHSLASKFVKHKEIILNLLKQKPLGFAINDLENNEYFNDFFTSKNFEATTYIDVIVKVTEIPVTVKKNLILTPQYFDTLKNNKKNIKHYLKKSTESFVSLDDLYLSLFIDKNLITHICKHELSCEIISDDVLNRFANSLSQRKRIIETIQFFDGTFKASDVVDRISKDFPSEKLTEARVTSYISSLDDIWIYDWGTYIRKDVLPLSSTFKEDIKNKCEAIMREKKAIYSFYTLANHVKLIGMENDYVTPFILGRILIEDRRFVKAGKIRVALNIHFPNTADQTIEDNLESIFFEKQSPQPLSEIREILINDFGYAATTVSMFLIKTPLLIKVDSQNVATKEFCGLEPSQINAIQSQILGSLKESSYQMLGLNNFIKKISSEFRISKTMAESIIKITKDLHVSPDIDVISMNPDPMEHFLSQSNKEITQLLKSLQGNNGEEILTLMVSGLRTQLNTLHIYPDDEALRTHVVGLL